jgi:hypothetical protein
MKIINYNSKKELLDKAKELNRIEDVLETWLGFSFRVYKNKQTIEYPEFKK